MTMQSFYEIYDVYGEDEGYVAAGAALDKYKTVTLNPTADPELIDEALRRFDRVFANVAVKE